MRDRPSVLVVVQRYGEVSGGAEAHARELVTHLRPHADLAVATTTAADYWTWENTYTAGIDAVDGVPVHRFPVESGRTRDFRLREHRAFAKVHPLAAEDAFVRAQGPVAPELLEHLRRYGRDFDAVLFFTYIYYPTVYGLPLVPERAVLVPTAHDEPALRLSVYRRLFHAPRAFAFNSVEERRLVHRTFANERIPSDIVGVGVDVPARRDASRFRARFGIEGPYLLYLGRIVESKGCGTLFDHFQRWQRTTGASPATLVLAGRADPEMPVPSDPRIRHVGGLSDQQKFDALAGATALVMPSLLESLSMVTLEAWATGRPVIVDARSPVLSSMAARAGAGLAYRSWMEFAEIAELLIADGGLGDRLGRAGERFVQATYTWPVVVEKYRDLFAEVAARNS
ncbi:MAG TPA: hexosyltransferase [Chloroflexi bacterium]|jgi:glycosyltransferase involved in cell wall biosynthesis|nr:hexosyltransferase [Chloroflexota bacterium]HAL26145.1 hexosyltransferase [Chloroflexota bacterium]